MTFNALIAAVPDTQLIGCSSLQCADISSKSCGSSGGFGGSNLTQLWAVYELVASGARKRNLVIIMMSAVCQPPLSRSHLVAPI